MRKLINECRVPRRERLRGWSSSKLLLFSSLSPSCRSCGSARK